MFKRSSRANHPAHLELLESRQLLSAAGLVTETNLVTDGFVPAQHTDANDLKNPWGVAFQPGGAFWVSDNNSGLATLYDGNGVKQSLRVTVPGPGGAAGTPTGQVFNGGSGFQIHEGTKGGPAAFIFVAEDGTITAWNPGVDLNNAVPVIDNSASGAVYKGAALVNANGSTELFVTNFRSGQVEVYDSNFARVTLPANAFVDKHLPGGFAPFNVAQINGNVYVTYAKQDAAKHDDTGGPGAGFVDVFSTSGGKLLHRFNHGRFMNSPWGLAVAPSSWGRLAGDILVGQFKSGQIDVFSPNGHFISTLDDQAKHPVTIDGLWDLTPGSGSGTASTQDIYFTAGSNGEADGLFGKLSFTPITHHRTASSSPSSPTASPVDSSGGTTSMW